MSRMAGYADSGRRAPRTLTEREQDALLAATREHPRDHVLYAMALGTGLRAHELVALDVGDVFDAAGEPKRRVLLRVFKGDGRGEDDLQEVVLEGSRRLANLTKELIDHLPLADRDAAGFAIVERADGPEYNPARAAHARQNIGTRPVGRATPSPLGQRGGDILVVFRKSDKMRHRLSFENRDGCIKGAEAKLERAEVADAIRRFDHPFRNIPAERRG
jgi:integrase